MVILTPDTTKTEIPAASKKLFMRSISFSSSTYLLLKINASIKTKIEDTAQTVTNTGIDTKNEGGVLPIRVSLSIPPPKVVINARKTTPKRSVSLSIATSAPETAKEITPIISIM